MRARLLQRTFSRWTATCFAALLCACGMGPQSESTLRRFANHVDIAGRGYSGDLQLRDMVALGRLGICRGDITQLGEHFESELMVHGRAPMLGVDSGQVSRALADSSRRRRGLGPIVWFPCVQPTDVSGVAASELRLGAVRIQLTGGEDETARLRLIGSGLDNCTRIVADSEATSLDIMLNATDPGPTIRTATLDAGALEVLQRATNLNVCGTVHALDATQRARLQKFVVATYQLGTNHGADRSHRAMSTFGSGQGRLPAGDTTADAAVRRDLLMFLEISSRQDHRTPGPLTGVSSAIIGRRGGMIIELWRIDGDTGPLRYIVTLEPNPNGGTNLGISPERGHAAEVVEAGRAALDRGEYNRAAWILTLPAERGDAVAQNALGAMYLGGLGVPQSAEKAAALFLKAAEQGNAKGEFNLALLYDQGNGVARSMEQALSWARRAAEHGYPQAHGFVGTFYARGEVVQQDWAQAEGWYRKAAELGDPVGTLYLGVMYSLGQGVAKNDATAFEWFRKSAEHGWPAGLVALGHAHEDGRGTPRDDRAARDCYQRAQQAGHLEGAFLLGLLMLSGRGGVTDEAKGRELISQAAAGGLEEARAFVAAQTPP